MKKIYLVKKDVNKPAGEGNWIKMNSYEFAMFMKTPEGKERKKCFAQIDACDFEDDIIIAECDKHIRNKIRSEKKAHDRFVQNNESIGYTVFSYNEQESTEDDLTGEELIKDEAINVEETVIEKLCVESLREALQELDEAELDLINHLFLNENTMSIKQYAKNLGVAETTINYRRDKILVKIRKFMKRKK